MKLVIVAGDGRISIDDVSYDGADLSQLDPAIHAVQWYGEYGEVEYKSVFADGQITKPQNQIITSIDSYQWAFAAWSVAAAAVAAEEAAIAAETQPAVSGTQTL